MKKSALIPIGAILIIICFYLPWVKACGVKVSGYQLASDEDIGEPIYWAILICGILILGAYFLAKKPRALVILSAIVGLLVMLIKYFRLITQSEGRELGLTLEVGGYGTIIGLILAFIGGLSKKNAPEESHVNTVSSDADRTNTGSEEEK